MELYIAGLDLYPTDACERLQRHAASLLARVLSANPRAFASVRSGGRASFLETQVGPASLALVISLRSGDSAESPISTKHRSDAARVLQHAIRTALDEPVNEDGCEVLYGRAGLLYALLLLRKHLPNKTDGADELHTIVSDEVVEKLVDDIVRRGGYGARSYREALPSGAMAPALMWSWHGKRYLGGAHGLGERAVRPSWLSGKSLLTRYSWDTTDTLVVPDNDIETTSQILDPNG
jgi:hypothetical protein